MFLVRKRLFTVISAVWMTFINNHDAIAVNLMIFLVDSNARRFVTSRSLQSQAQAVFNPEDAEEGVAVVPIMLSWFIFKFCTFIWVVSMYFGVTLCPDPTFWVFSWILGDVWTVATHYCTICAVVMPMMSCIGEAIDATRQSERATHFKITPKISGKKRVRLERQRRAKQKHQQQKQQ